ncbi:MAG: MTH895/ArsE family thioredoxin-like protein [Gemmatimonadota bacterium]|nr:MTH895/ArsE family thioredoxin-like protein [Gemmatimonadota bacterium]
MKIQIYGPGCTKCRMLEANAAEAAAELGFDVEIEKVSDVQAIAAAGVLSTPGLAVDGTIRSTGRLLSAHQIRRLLQEEGT